VRPSDIFPIAQIRLTRSDKLTVPRRVLCRAVERRLAGEGETELARIRPAEDHEAGALEPAHMLAIRRGRRRIGEEARAARHPDAREPAAQIFQEKRHAAKRAVRQTVRDGLSPVIVTAWLRASFRRTRSASPSASYRS